MVEVGRATLSLPSSQAVRAWPGVVSCVAICAAQSLCLFILANTDTTMTELRYSQMWANFLSSKKESPSFLHFLFPPASQTKVDLMTDDSVTWTLWTSVPQIHIHKVHQYWSGWPVRLISWLYIRTKSTQKNITARERPQDVQTVVPWPVKMNLSFDRNMKHYSRKGNKCFVFYGDWMFLMLADGFTPPKNKIVFK